MTGLLTFAGVFTTPVLYPSMKDEPHTHAVMAKAKFFVKF